MSQPVAEAAEADRYAAVLGWGVKLGFILLVASFGLYLADTPAARVPAEQMRANWHLSHLDYAAAVGSAANWAWTASLPASDALCLLAVAWLCGLTMLALAATLPVALRHQDRGVAWFALIELLLLVLSAAGALSATH